MATTTQTFTGTGSQTQFSIAFSYRTTADVKATINAVATTAFSVSGSTVTFTSAPANGAAVVIFRETDNATIEADFQSGSALRAVDLNDNFEQLLFVTQESTNTANTADTNASAAVTTANTASSNATTAVNTANAATTTANSATATANSAVTTANSATATANAATTTANTASTNATAAVNTANTASSNATAAVNTANTASSNATAAVNTANTASSNATTAVNTANAATTTANAASAAVANAVLYDPVANVAAIPGSPSNGDYVEVQDSTGIQSFSPLSGMPSGFIGDSGLVVRLKYVTSPSTTWQWQNYFAKDSETRYLKDNAAQIVDADINSSAAIGLSKLATGALPSGITVASANITDGTIVDADISGSAAIGLTKLATGALPTAITVTSANISDLSIVNADVNASAAIAGTKISPNFGSQDVTTTGSGTFGGGDLTINSSGNLLCQRSGSTGFVDLNSTGILKVRGAASGSVFLIQDSSTGNTTASVLGNGSASFAGDLTIADKIIHSGDTNTAIRFPAADTVSVETSGSERLRIDSSGNLFIGGTTASAADIALNSNGSATFASNILVGQTTASSTNPGGYIYSTRWQANDDVGSAALNGVGASGNLAAFLAIDRSSGGGEVATIDYDGSASFKGTVKSTKVLSGANDVLFHGQSDIGQSANTLADKFVVKSDGSATFAGSVSATVGSFSGNVTANRTSGSQTCFNGALNGSTTSNILADGSATFSGNVGVGTASNYDDSVLEVRKTAGGDGVAIRVTNNTTTDGSQSGIIFTNSTADFTSAAIAHKRNDNALIFYNGQTSGSGGFANATERMRIDSSGRLLLGTTTAGESTADNLTIGDSGHCGITLRSGTTSVGSMFFADGTSGNDQYRGLIQYDHSGNFLKFATNAQERMRVDSSGQVAIGDTAAVAPLHVRHNSTATSGVVRGLTLKNGSATNSNRLALTFASINNFDIAAVNGVIESHAGQATNAAGRLEFYTNGSGDSSATERMRIDSSGNIIFNYSNVLGVGKVSLAFYGQTENGHVIQNTWSGNATYLQFRNSNSTAVGSITATTSATSYNTGSDYRLKENVVDLTDGITRVKQLQPRRFNFIVDADTTVDGFVAHEAQTVVPEAITGTKDEVDDDGNAVMQGIDQSKLVPLLTAALQEAIAKIETLEAKVAALEAA